MKLILITLVVAVATVQSLPVLKDFDTEWANFKEVHGKQYKSVHEESLRKAIFKSNYELIRSHNEEYQNGQHTYFLKINHLADLTAEEMKVFNGYKNIKSAIEEDVFKPDPNVKLPESVDWRTEGAVTSVKNQGSFCGSCWAFSAVGALEGQHFLKTKSLQEISTQNLVDCSKNGGNDGCDGGDMNEAFKYVHSNDGIDSERNYPYEAKNGKCRYKAQYNVTSLKGFSNIEEGKEDHLKAAVATIGPISVAIDADHLKFSLYGGGIFYELLCKTKNDDLDHGVLAVGYGTENSLDYWWVKNSWGRNWGIGGYIKMSRNKNNNCGIATSASYPLMY